MEKRFLYRSWDIFFQSVLGARRSKFFKSYFALETYRKFLNRMLQIDSGETICISY
jgi:hypothetical protein